MMVLIIAMMAALVPIGFLWPKTDAFLILALAGLVVAYASHTEPTRAPTVQAQIVPASQPPGSLPVVLRP